MLVNFIVPDTAIVFDRWLTIVPRRRDMVKYRGSNFRVTMRQLVMQGEVDEESFPPYWSNEDFWRVTLVPAE